MHFPHIFMEGKIGTCVLKNRLIMSLYPTKYSTDSKVNERMIEFYRERARGGVAMIVLDCPCLDFPRFDRPEFAEGIKRLLNIIHSESAKAFMQLNYPKERIFEHEVLGAKQKGNVWVAPLIKIMTAAEAEEILQIMANGAKRAMELGYDGIEVQASYGDLISQLFSPLSNKRTDDYGGSIENRMRFLIKLIRLIKQEAGNDVPVMVKLVCDEFVDGGLTLQETTVIAQHIERAGGDAILANGGNKATKRMTIPSHYLSPGPLVHLARGIRNAVTIPVIAVGKIHTPELADKILKEQDADFVAMARSLIADPHLPRKAEAGMVEDIRFCLSDLEDCADKGVKGLGRSCTTNPFSGQEYRLKITPASEKKKVVVIGGGPAGIQSAILASRRGHEVTLYEKGSLGGQLHLACRAPFKDGIHKFCRYLRYSLAKTNVKAILGKAVSPEEILSQKPDVVIIATGSKSFLPPIPGIDLPFVFNVRSLYEKTTVVPGKNIIIIGAGDIGCETADMLSSESKTVTIVELCNEPLTRMKEIPRQELLNRLQEKGVSIITTCKVTAIEDGKVLIEDKTGPVKELKADSVVISVGSIPENSLHDALKDKVKEIYTIGDAKEPGNIGAALRSATEVGVKM
jgi:2,4-dienoyl-CoA reductase-like NADH-dependent reductase (Old Yellow Enzyme family)/NADPH-dependent 2,4-dienoyl-CoA reductase/sulfur reductase-like enzyme